MDQSFEHCSNSAELYRHDYRSGMMLAYAIMFVLGWTIWGVVFMGLTYIEPGDS